MPQGGWWEGLRRGGQKGREAQLKGGPEDCPRTWAFTQIEMEPIWVLNPGGMRSDRGFNELIQGPLWRRGHRRAGLGVQKARS